MPITADESEGIVAEFYRNRRLAHEVLFKHRHPIRTPAFHHEIQDAFHGDHPQVVLEGFRDAAKSTVAEEAFVLKALFKEFKLGLIVGPTLPRARERLVAVSNEFQVNDEINQLFGPMEGPVWGSDRIVLRNEVCIQAVGAGQSIRGIRYLDARPDFVLIDDLEDEESVKTPEARDATLKWLFSTFIPALAKGEAGKPGYKLRFMGSRLDRDAVIVKVANDPAWQHLRFPIMEQAEDGTERYDLPPGKWKSLWEAKFSLEDIAAKRAEYSRLGLLGDFDCEYMCEADNPAARIFSTGDAKTVAHLRTWQATYAAYDPARTTHTTSAMTGVAVFSWLGNKLVVWKGDAQLWLPDAIISNIFDVNDEWSPVEIGVEATGLEEFIMQPLRHEALTRRVVLPVRRLDPPRGKTTFIRGLQPLFKAGEIEFVDVSAEARGQLMSFPTGRVDFPNALAYALVMKPGLPVYDFGREATAPELLRYPNQPWYLAVNATQAYTCGILIQVVDGQTRVHADWIREGPPGETLADVYREARLDAGHSVRIVVPPSGLHDVVGLRLAVRGIQTDPRTGGTLLRGRAAIRDNLQRRRREQALLVVSYAARRVLNGLSGGYAWAVDKHGRVQREVAENQYKVLIEGLESFMATQARLDEDEDKPRYATDASGRAYKTIRANAEPEKPSKDDWHQFDIRDDVRTLRRG